MSLTQEQIRKRLPLTSVEARKIADEAQKELIKIEEELIKIEDLIIEKARAGLYSVDVAGCLYKQVIDSLRSNGFIVDPKSSSVNTITWYNCLENS